LGLVVVAFGNIVGGGVRLVLRCGQDRTREGTTDLVGEEANVRRFHKAHPLTSLGPQLDGGDWVYHFDVGLSLCAKRWSSSNTTIISYLLIHQLFSTILLLIIQTLN